MLTPENTGIVGLVLNNQTPFVEQLRKVIQQNQGVVRHGELNSEGPSNMPGGGNVQGEMQGGNLAAATAGDNKNDTKTNKVEIPVGVMPGSIGPIQDGGNMPSGSSDYQMERNLDGNPHEDLLIQLMNE